MTAPERPPELGHISPQPSFITRLIATGCFTGYIPWASGTFGSLLGIAVYLIPGAEQPLPLAFLILGGFAAGVLTGGRVAAAEGHRLSRTGSVTKAIFQPGEHETPDPSIVVIDEIVGMWLSLFMLPKSMAAIAIAFILFRVLDIVKPPPARQLERIPDGWGIMLDDVVAGLLANILARAVLLIL